MPSTFAVRGQRHTHAADSHSRRASASRVRRSLAEKRAPWRTVDEVDLAAARWVEWWNYRCLLGPVA